jgi:RimJ/RimL family protein N-acetyltransferase
MASAPPRSPIPRIAELDLVIETARLRLRPFTERDVDDIWPFVSDPAFPAKMSWAAHTDRSETRAFVERANRGIADNTGATWAIEHAGKAVGCVGFHDICWQVRALRLDRGDLGYWLAPALWGQGLMTEAAHAVVRYGFDTVGLHKVTVSCLAHNAPSRRVIEKVAFRYVGRSEEDIWRDGAWHAHLRYELTAPEWPDVHTTMRVQRPKLDQ